MPRKKKQPAEAAPAVETPQGPAEAGDEAAQGLEAGAGQGFVARRQMTKGGGISKKIVKHQGLRPLNPEELPEMQRRIKEGYSLKLGLLEELKLKAAGLKEVKGRLNQQIKELEADLAFVATGSRPELRRCLVIKDYSSGLVVTSDAEPGEIYEERELKNGERQGQLFSNDCNACKYCDCGWRGSKLECPENFEDCFQCPQFTCALSLGYCNQKNNYQYVDLAAPVDMAVAAALDCYFCRHQTCTADPEGCGRRSDCHSCEHSECEAGQNQIKGGYCEIAGKGVAEPEGDEAGDGGEGGDGAIAPDLCRSCKRKTCNAARGECSTPDKACFDCDNLICRSGRQCPQEKARAGAVE